LELTAPWAGTLDDVPLADILGRLSREKRSGSLTLLGSNRVEMSVSSGELEWAESKEEGGRFVDVLLRKGLIQGPDLEEVRAASGSLPLAALADRLVEKGLISRQVVSAELAAYSLDVACAAIGRTEDKFSFEGRAASPTVDAGSRTPLSGIILEGVRRMPESVSFVERLGDLSFPAGPAQDLSRAGQSLSLTPEEAYVLSLCDGTIALKDILRMGRSQARAAQAVYSLVASGLVEVHAPSAIPEPAPSEAKPPIDEPASFAFEVAIPRVEADEKARLEVARRSYLEGRKLIDQKDYYGAIVLLNETVRLCPQNPEYRFRLAGALAKNPLWKEKALQQYGEAFKLDPIRQELLREYAELLADCGRFVEAQKIARKLLEKYPDELRNKLLLARCDNAVLESSRGPERGANTADSPETSPENRGSLLARIFRRDPKPQ
jgi:tetratricopeptide (TPR) repeat protein